MTQEGDWMSDCRYAEKSHSPDDPSDEVRIVNEWCDEFWFYINRERREAVLVTPTELNFYESCVIFTEDQLERLKGWCDRALGCIGTEEIKG